MHRDRDLHGVTVVLTRRREDNAPLAAAARTAGAEVVELPCTWTAPLEDPREPAAALRSLRPIDVLVLTSRAGVRAAADALGGSTLKCGVAVVGEATARQARASGMTVCFVPSRPDGGTLGRELPLPSGDVLLARSDLADDELPAILRGRGARIREVVAYRTEARIDGDPTPMLRSVATGKAVIVVASPSAVDALAVLGQRHLGGATFVAIGPRTAARVREVTRARVVVAADPSPSAILSAMTALSEEVHA